MKVRILISSSSSSSSSSSNRIWLLWDVVYESPYELHMLQEEYCQVVCKKTFNNKATVQYMKRFIEQGYHSNHIIDNSLPAAAIGLNAITGEKQKHYAGGFPVGFIHTDNHEYYMFNHLNIYVDYYKVSFSDRHYQVVGYGIEPLSIAHQHQQNSDATTCDLQRSRKKHWNRQQIWKNQIIQDNQTVLFTYDVIWRQSDVEWTNRWDVYLSEDHLVPPQVHLYSIFNSAFTIVIILVIALVIWIRKIRHAAKLAPIASGDDVDVEDIMDEQQQSSSSSGGGKNKMKPLQIVTPGTSSDKQKWRLLHGDVFRPPYVSPMMLVVFCGTGAQLLATILVSLILYVIGIISEIYPGTIIIGTLAIYTTFGSWVGGYTVSKFFQQLQLSPQKQQMAIVATASFFPGMSFVFFLLINIWARVNQSSMAVPIWPVGIVMVVVWAITFVPLTMKGAQQGFSKPMTPFPVDTAETSRPIPQRCCCIGYFCPIFSWLMNGIFPFSVCYVELFFLMTSLWMDQYFDSFGYFTVVVVLMIATCSSLSILTTYWQLSRENHRWWWTAFRNGTSTGVLTFLYSIIWYRSLEPTWGYRLSFPMVLYFGTSFLISTGVALALGFVSVASSLVFNRAIYSMIAAIA